MSEGAGAAPGVGAGPPAAAARAGVPQPARFPPGWLWNEGRGEVGSGMPALQAEVPRPAAGRLGSTWALRSPQMFSLEKHLDRLDREISP